MVVSERYDEEVKPTAKTATGTGGRHVIAVIGIDRYEHWPRLSNAVRDAIGAAALFQRHAVVASGRAPKQPSESWASLRPRLYWNLIVR
jgi:hypothetical protein